MPRGGARPGAGRKKGSVAKVDAEARQKALEQGETPLDYMLRVMRDTEQDPRRRDDMAKACAPYLHARLQSVEVTGDPDNPLEVINRIERVIVGAAQDAADRDAAEVPTTH